MPNRGLLPEHTKRFHKQLRLLLVILTFMMFGCSGAAHKYAQGKFMGRVPPAYLSVGSKPSYCLALSGGGIRSGATSLGVIQELHAQGVAEEFSAYRLLDRGALLKSLLI